MTNQEIICRVLGWSLGTYNIHQYNAGRTYLKLNTGTPAQMDMMLKAASWWYWWMQQWKMRNQVFINQMRLEPNQPFNLELQPHYEELYCLEHEPAALKVFPSQALMKLVKAESNNKLTVKHGTNQ